ncbi:MAG: hypothetical protein JSV96_06155 [Candidatus Aminicenantes bacterium]|nr:MAG: hypothetical protein JSV96_06155 [Candidatus Aminicenantes bacterium]
MKEKITTIFALLITALMVSPMTAQELPFKVIVNASNPISSMTKSQVSNLFLKKVIEWENGLKVLPVDLVERFTVRQRFTNEIHGRKIRAVKAYWNKQKFSGRNLPPPEKASYEEVLKYVEENVGAIGYIPVSIQIEGYKVKVLTIK